MKRYIDIEGMKFNEEAWIEAEREDRKHMKMAYCASCGAYEPISELSEYGGELYCGNCISACKDFFDEFRTENTEEVAEFTPIDYDEIPF